jgi:hypothetical protein
MVWEQKVSRGTVPDCRDETMMMAIDGRLFMFGGFGRDAFNDMRIYSYQGTS